MIPDDPLLTEAVRAALDRVQVMRPPTPTTRVSLIAISSLADGADRLVAEQVINKGGGLEALLPMPERSYIADFSPASTHEFRTLLSQAAKRTYACPAPKDDEDRTTSYQEAAHAVVDRCDVLLALWDGQETERRGGTAETVAYARHEAKPLIIVSTFPPFTVTEERTEDPIDELPFNRLNRENAPSIRWRQFACSELSIANELLPRSTPVIHGMADLRDYITPYLTRADQLALRFQRRFYFWAYAIYLLAFLAAVSVVAQMLFAPDREVLAFPELVCLAGIIVAVLVARRNRYHEKWMIQRFLAERLRSSFYLAVVGVRMTYETDDSRPQITDVNADWLVRAVDSIFSKLPPVIPAGSDVSGLRHLLSEAWVGPQIKYHKSTSASLLWWDGFMIRLISGSFGLTFVAVVLHIAGFWSASSMPAEVVVLASVTLPVLGSGLSGIRAQREFRHHADRYSSMAGMLAAHQVALGGQATLGGVRAEAIRTEQEMQNENREWFGVIRFHDIELQGG